MQRKNLRNAVCTLGRFFFILFGWHFSVVLLAALYCTMFCDFTFAISSRLSLGKIVKLHLEQKKFNKWKKEKLHFSWQLSWFRAAIVE